eukprot:TRINITY_DN2806_c0_g1_i1.p1 TRINITY_DN2806_c0_g1~~TRINITY_DN2806_c0_g1_i1.p1  ORF type:complete len:1449 (+),score=227.79 TRINITY_DN2806_c0_g1_i1:312-4349(+)
MASFALDSDYGWGSSWAATATAAIRVPRTFVWKRPHSCVELEVLMLVFLCASAVFTVAITALYLRYGTTFHTEGKTVLALRLLLQACAGALHLPVMHITLEILFSYGQLNCPIYAKILSAILFVGFNAMAFVSSVAQYEFLRTTKNFLARYLSRVELLQFTSAIVLSITYHATRLGEADASRLQGMLVCGLLILYAIAGITLICWTAPYYRWSANHARQATFLSLGFVGLCGLIQTAVDNKTARLVLFIVACAGVVPLLAAGFFLSVLFFRATLRPLMAKLARIVQARQRTDDSAPTAADEDVLKVSLSSLWQIQFIVVHCYWDTIRRQPQVAAEVTEETHQLIVSSLENIKQRGEAETLYCLFTLSTSDELQPTFVHIKRAFSQKLWPDVLLLLHRVEEHRKALAHAFDGGAEDIAQGCKEAQRHVNKAKEAMKKFWRYLLQEDVESLHQTFAELDKHEQKAFDIFTLMRQKYTKSTKVLRQFAQFLDEVRQEHESAQSLYILADNIEEFQAKAHRHKQPARRLRTGPSSLLSPRRSNRVAPETVPGGEPHQQQAQSAVTFEENLAVQTGHEHAVGNVATHNEDLGDPDSDGAANAKNSAVAKLTYYRERVATHRSWAYIQLIITVAFIILFTLCAITVAFALSYVALQRLIVSFHYMYEASKARTLVPSTTLLLEELLAELNCGANQTQIADSRGILYQYGIELESTAQHIYENAESGNYVNVDLFTQSSYNVSNWNPYSFMRSFSTESLIDLAHDFSRRSCSVALHFNFTTAAEMSNDPDVRFMLDNGHMIAREAFNHMVDEYQRMVIGQVNYSRIVLFVVLPVSLTLLCLLSVVLFAHAMFILKRHRKNSLQLFLSIPHTVVASIYSSCGGELDTKNTFRCATSTKSVRVDYDRNFVFRFLAGALVLVAFLVAIYVYSLVALTNYADPIKFADLRMSEVTYLRRCHVLATAYLNQDTLTYGSMEDIGREIADARATYSLVRLESGQIANDKSFDTCFPSIFHLIMEKPCENLLSNNRTYGSCSGLYNLDLIFLDQVLLFTQSVKYPWTGWWDNPYFSLLSSMEFELLYSWHSDYNIKLLNEWTTKMDRDQIVVIVLCAAAWPLAVIFYVSLHFPIQRVRKEHAHTLKMFLLLPVDVIEASRDIRHFLETGNHISTDQRMQNMLHDTQHKFERILQAAADAIIIYHHSTLQIEIFNAAACDLFGYTVEEVTDMRISTLLPELDFSAAAPDTAAAETVAVPKDGTEFPVFASRSASTEMESAAVFIRDVRDIRAYQSLIEKNEELLLKILPKTIALRLKDTLAADPVQGPATHLIADRHENVFSQVLHFLIYPSGEHSFRGHR